MPPTQPEKLYEKTMTRALKLLGYKPRSVAEMRARLNEKGWADARVVEQVIARLGELGYLDDEQFAARYADARLTVKPLGRTRLRRDLQRKQVSAQVVEQALEQAYETHSEEELLARAIAKRTRLKGAPATRAEAKKLFDYLIRRGFSYDLVIKKLKGLNKLAADPEESE